MIIGEKWRIDFWLWLSYQGCLQAFDLPLSTPGAMFLPSQPISPCLGLAILVKTSANNPSKKSVVLESSVRQTRLGLTEYSTTIDSRCQLFQGARVGVIMLC